MTPLGRILSWPFRMGAVLLQPDKQAHFYWGATIGLCALKLDWLIALAVVLLMATLKEGYDFLNPPHQCEVWDLIATLLGGCMSVWLIFLRLHHAA